MIRIFIRNVLAGFFSLCFLVFPCSPALAGEKTTTESIGDVLHIALPVLGFGGTFFAGSPDGKKWDKQGTYQLLKTLAVGVTATEVFKYSGNKIRPSRSDNRSFVSGHTSFAFEGAGFIHTRYGNKWGIPALLAGAYVGYSRIYADAHYADDVLGGASVGLMSSWLMTTPQTESGSSLLPFKFDGGAGLQLTIQPDRTNSTVSAPSFEESRRILKYDFAFGPAYLSKNEVKAPTDTGTSFNLNNFHKNEDPTTTAGVTISYFVDEKNEVSIMYMPFESRDSGSFNSQVFFAGQLFPADTLIYSDWLHHDIRGRWRYNLLPESPWELKLGAGAFYQDTEVSLKTEGDTVSADVRDRAILPFIHGVFGYKFRSGFSVMIDGDILPISSDFMLDTGISFNYRLNEKWDIGMGYRHYSRDIELNDLNNKIVYKIPFMTISYSWLSD